jgi:transcriptional regulator with XRE-family HTH domain
MMGRRKISGARLAAALHQSGQWLSYRLNGRQTLDVDDLQRIADALGCQVAELLQPALEARARWRPDQATSVAGVIPLCPTRCYSPRSIRSRIGHGAARGHPARRRPLGHQMVTLRDAVRTVRPSIVRRNRS